jgi:hypothetical protein
VGPELLQLLEPDRRSFDHPLTFCSPGVARSPGPELKGNRGGCTHARPPPSPPLPFPTVSRSRSSSGPPARTGVAELSSPTPRSSRPGSRSASGRIQIRQSFDVEGAESPTWRATSTWS